MLVEEGHGARHNVLVFSSFLNHCNCHSSTLLGADSRAYAFRAVFDPERKLGLCLLEEPIAILRPASWAMA